MSVDLLGGSISSEPGVLRPCLQGDARRLNAKAPK